MRELILHFFIAFQGLFELVLQEIILLAQNRKQIHTLVDLLLKGLNVVHLVIHVAQLIQTRIHNIHGLADVI